MTASAALAFSATLGWGVLLAIGTILVYQGTLSLGANGLAPLLAANPQVITEVTATGGSVLVAIGFKLPKFGTFELSVCCRLWLLLHCWFWGSARPVTCCTKTDATRA